MGERGLLLWCTVSVEGMGSAGICVTNATHPGSAVWWVCLCVRPSVRVFHHRPLCPVRPPLTWMCRSALYCCLLLPLTYMCHCWVSLLSEVDVADLRLCTELCLLSSLCRHVYLCCTLWLLRCFDFLLTGPTWTVSCQPLSVSCCVPLSVLCPVLTSAPGAASDRRRARCRLWAAGSSCSRRTWSAQRSGWPPPPPSWPRPPTLLTSPSGTLHLSIRFLTGPGWGDGRERPSCPCHIPLITGPKTRDNTGNRELVIRGNGTATFVMTGS